jgi:hypothetical protein
MRLEIVVFLVLLGIFLFWKFGRGSLPKFTLPKIGMSGISGNKWWAEKDDDGKRFILYIIITLLAYVAYLIPSSEYQAATRGIVALLGVHLIWGFFSKKGSHLSKVVVYGILAFFVLAWLLPDVVKIRDASIMVTKKLVADASDGAMSFARNYEGGISETSSPIQRVVPAPVIHHPQPQTIEVVAVQGAFTEVRVPPSTRFEWATQEGCLVAIMHNSIPQAMVYDCAENIQLGENIRNLRLGFSSKTDQPVKVTVTLTPV